MSLEIRDRFKWLEQGWGRMKVTAKTGRNSKLLLGLTQSSALACTQSTDQTKENFALDKDAKIVICLYPRITVRFLIAKKSLRLSR
ncbi:hypothetical protein CLOSTMETH_02121, partial [[Clostridium] methylpentosum DSM 5476]